MPSSLPASALWYPSPSLQVGSSLWGPGWWFALITLPCPIITPSSSNIYFCCLLSTYCMPGAVSRALQGLPYGILSAGPILRMRKGARSQGHRVQTQV